MDYLDYLHKIIEDGIAAARQSYASSPNKLEGSIEGFEACRTKTPSQLGDILKAAVKATATARIDGTPIWDYWKIRCKEAEIEWVCSCVSAVLMNEGKPTITRPTARAIIKAAEVIGVRESSEPSN